MSYVNADGLEILTAGEQGTAAKRGTSLSSQKKALVMNITGTEVPSAAATPQDHDAFIPAGSYITSASLIVSTAFTSAGSATLTIGAYQQDGTTVDADGIDATIDVDVTNTLPTNTTSITSANDASLSTTNGGNIIDINVDGGASGAGHVIDLDLDGAANVVTIDQSGTAQKTVVLDATTNGSTIDITQSD